MTFEAKRKNNQANDFRLKVMQLSFCNQLFCLQPLKAESF